MDSLATPNVPGLTREKFPMTDMDMMTMMLNARQNFANSSRLHHPFTKKVESAKPYIGHKILSQTLSPMRASSRTDMTPTSVIGWVLL
jgi:hypothetical protein